MNATGEKIIIALDAIFDGEEKKAEAIIFNYLNNSAGIGEHSVPNPLYKVIPGKSYKFSVFSFKPFK